MQWPMSARIVSSSLAVIATLSTGVAGYLFFRVPDGPVSLEPPQLVALVRSSFPAQYASAAEPLERQWLAFLLDRRKNLRQATLTQSAEGESITATLSRAFPQVSLAGNITAGSACFPAKGGEHGKFCAMWLVPAEL